MPQVLIEQSLEQRGLHMSSQHRLYHHNPQCISILICLGKSYKKKLCGLKGTTYRYVNDDNQGNKSCMSHESMRASFCHLQHMGGGMNP